MKSRSKSLVNLVDVYGQTGNTIEESKSTLKLSYSMTVELQILFERLSKSGPFAVLFGRHCENVIGHHGLYRGNGVAVTVKQPPHRVYITDVLLRYYSNDAVFAAFSKSRSSRASARVSVGSAICACGRRTRIFSRVRSGVPLFSAHAACSSSAESTYF